MISLEALQIINFSFGAIFGYFIFQIFINISKLIILRKTNFEEHNLGEFTEEELRLSISIFKRQTLTSLFLLVLTLALTLIGLFGSFNIIKTLAV